MTPEREAACDTRSASRDAQEGYWLPVLILMAAYTLAFIDRQVVNILAESIKADLKLTDTQLGLLTGLGFTILYALAGLPIARLAERANRPWIIAASLSIWSLFTALCGTARAFPALLLYRAGVGLGEGGCVPAAHSLIVDYAPPSKRASAFAVFNMAVPIGTLIGMGLGGILASMFGWRAVFLILGIPGILAALALAWLLPEPRRARAAQQGHRSDWSQVRVLLAKPSYRYAVAGGAMKAFVTYGQAPFLASFVLRNHADQLDAMAARWGMMPSGLLGVIFGLTAAFLGISGAWIGGQIADHFGARSKRIYLLLPACAALLIIPFNLAAFAVADLTLIFCFLAVPVFLNALWLGPVGATIQSVAPEQARATASALNLLVVNILGLGFGPLIVGVMSDTLAFRMGAASGLTWSLAISTLFGLFTAMLFYLGSRSIDRDVRNASEAATSDQSVASAH